MTRTILLLFILSTSFLVQAQDGIALIQEMCQVIDATEGARFTLKKTERFGKKHLDAEFNVKFKSRPLNIFSYSVYPNGGSEILWKDGQPKALVKQGTFPYLTLNLGLFNYFVLKDNHHILTHTPFTYFGGILKALLSKVNTNGNRIEYISDVSYNGIDCYHVKMFTDNYFTENITITKAETLIEFADRNFLSSFQLKTLNDLDFDDMLQVGQTIKSTNEYAKSLDIYINKKSMLPVFLDIYDEKGRFEKYEFINVEWNPNFESDEFERGFKDYNF